MNKELYKKLLNAAKVEADILEESVLKLAIELEDDIAIAKNAAVQKELAQSYLIRAVTQQLARMWVSRYYPDTLRIELVKPQQKSATTEDVAAALAACGADYPNVTLISENLNFQVFEVRI